ncbi:MAG: hypothetical protein Q4F39_06165 [Bacteroidia bacterium]|nr:hypothetical protein [Bacteroidia bacterium]
MKKSVIACLTGILCLSTACVSGNGNGGSNQDADEAAVASESSAVAEESAVKEEIKPFNLYESDFHVKYNAYSWKTASDYSSATRNKDNDGSWEITKTGDTMTVVEDVNHLEFGRMTVTTVYKESDGNVVKTSTTVFKNQKYNAVANLVKDKVKPTVFEGSTLDKIAQNWFNAKDAGHKGAFVMGSRDPRYADSERSVTVTDGDAMFGRNTLVYKSEPKKGTILDLTGYYIGGIEIYDAQRSGDDYIRYKAWLVLKDGVERLSFEVTEFEIL